MTWFVVGVIVLLAIVYVVTHVYYIRSVGGSQVKFCAGCGTVAKRGEDSDWSLTDAWWCPNCSWLR